MAESNSSKPLSTLALNALKPGATIADTGEYRGLRVTCGQSGVKTFFYRYRSPANSKIKQVKIGRYKGSKLTDADDSADLLTLTDARVKFLELKALRDSGVCPGEHRKQQQEAAQQEAAHQQQQQTLNQITVKAICEQYLSECIDGVRSKKAAVEASRSLHRDPIKVFGDTPAVDLPPKQVADMVMDIVNRGSNVQAGFVLRELTAAFDHAIGRMLPGEHINPCYQAKGSLKRIRLSRQKRSRWLGDGELVALLRWLPDSRFTPAQRAVLNFTLMTGARTGEVCGMRWTDVDLVKGVWRLGKTKMNEARNVQLSTQAVEFLQQLQGKNDTWIFPRNTGRPLLQRAISERMYWMRQRECLIDLEHWTPHDLRRSVRTGLARLGCSFEVAEAVLGHTKQGMDAIYNLHSYEPQCREWLQRWCDHLEQLQQSETVVPMGVKHAAG